jgi:hypothetical protein
MPKLTRTGFEIGSSEAGAIIMGATAFQTRHEVLEAHKLAKAGVETLEQPYKWAYERGNHLEPAIAGMVESRINRMCEKPCEMWEPTEPFQKPRAAASIDRILKLADPITLVNGDGEEVTMSGTGVCEIKSDRYHHGRPKPEWTYQVLHQMYCADINWGIIGCFDQDFKLHLYPVERSTHRIDMMKDKYAEFWDLVDNDGEYPPDRDPDDVIAVCWPEGWDTNADIPGMADNYVQKSAEVALARAKVREVEREREDIKNELVDKMYDAGIKVVDANGYRIKSEFVRKPKRKMVETEDYTETLKFSVKELNNE